MGKKDVRQGRNGGREGGKKIRKDRREEGRQEGEEGGRGGEGGRVMTLSSYFTFKFFSCVKWRTIIVAVRIK